MRKTSFLLVVLSVFFGTRCATAITIADNGTAKAVIVIDKDASAPDQHAATELSAFLGQVTGAQFPVRNAREAGHPSLLVGLKAAQLADPTFSINGLGNEGIVIRTQGGDLILAGGEPRGTLYAVYTFLEEQVGCHWWSPSVSMIPSRPTLEIGTLNVRYIPPFEYRETDDPGALDGDWSVRNKFNGPYHNLDGVQGGKHSYIAINKWYNAGSFWTLIPPELYFGSHPEWFSLINGVRSHETNHSSLCLTNEQMRQELVKNQKLALLWNPAVDMVSISQTDDSGDPERCQCDNCVAVEKEEGAPSGLMIRFVNSVAEDLEKDYPHLTVATLAYHYTQKPPLHVKPRHNVVVQLCDIHCSFAVPLSDDRNKDFRDDLLGWRKICDRLYFWDYVGNFSYPLLPHPNFRVLGLNAKYLADLGVKGIFGEAPGGEVQGDQLAAMRSWMLGRLYWNPNLDAQKLMEQFCHGYYGPAGGEVLSYINVMEDSLATSGDELGLSSRPTAKFLSFDVLSKAWAHLQTAETEVRDDQRLHQKVEALQLSVIYPVLYNWDGLRAQAKAENAMWSMPNSIEELGKRFKTLTSENGINPADFSLPHNAQQAVR